MVDPVSVMVEEILVDSEAELREQVRAYRELAQCALRKLAEKQTQIDRQRDTIAMLREELRLRMGLDRGRAA